MIMENALLWVCRRSRKVQLVVRSRGGLSRVGEMNSIRADPRDGPTVGSLGSLRFRR